MAWTAQTDSTRPRLRSREEMEEIRDEFSATRSEFRGELADAVTTLRGELATAVALANAIADTNMHMRTLHEEALSRIATIGEGRQRGKSAGHRTGPEGDDAKR